MMVELQTMIKKSLKGALDRVYYVSDQKFVFTFYLSFVPSVHKVSNDFDP